MIYIGIDPGTSGGIAILSDEHSPRAFALKGMTDQDVFRFLAEQEPATVILEKVSSTPQMGVKSAFTFGESFGSLRMAAIAAGLRLITVSPQKWQASIGLKKIGGGIGQNGTEKKNRNKAKAQELFPSLRITHATADALLIAEYGRRQGI